MEITEHIDALRCQGDLLADAATRAGLDASVPTCPSWQVKDLLRHTGYIHRWAARHITECPDAVLDGPPEADILRGGAADPDLLVWFRAGHAATQDVRLRRAVEHGVRAFGDVPGRPAVDVPGVPEQVLDLPGRARRDRCVQAGPGGRVREQVSLSAQRVDVFGDFLQLSARRTTRAWAR